MVDPFESSRLKIARAKEHIEDLERQIHTFAQTKPYKRFTEVDPESRDRILHKIQFVGGLPRSFAVIVGEVINALREALDNAGYAVAIAAGKINPRFCMFPFGGSPAKFETNALGNCKDVPQEIIALFRRFKPYKGGDDLLWALSRISVGNKHKIGIIPCTTGFVNSTVNITGGQVGKPFYFQFLFRWDGAKQEATLAASNSDLAVNGDISFFIAFDQVEVVGGKPVISVLNKLVGVVEGIFLAIEAESRRLGFVK